MPSKSASQHRLIGYWHSHPEARPKSMSSGQVEEWLHADRGSPWRSHHAEGAAVDAQYPTPEDAAFARASGFGYGTPIDNYVQGNSRAISSPVPISGDIDKLSLDISRNTASNRATKADARDMLTQGALAANRSPLTALGYDPSHMGLDTSGIPYNLRGFYDPTRDVIWASQYEPSSIAHEATHRGIDKLANTVYGPWENNVQWAMGPGQEMLVRRIMDQQFKGVERGQGPVGDKQIEGSEVAARHLGLDTTRDTLQKMAADLIAQRQPRGPRATGGAMAQPSKKPPQNMSWMDALGTHVTHPDPRDHQGEQELNQIEQSIIKSQLPHQHEADMAGGGAVGQAMNIAHELPRQHFDLGGMPSGAQLPFFGREAEKEIVHEGGMLESQVPGRTDHIPLSVAAGSYVIPADVVSGLGEGNSLSGSRVLNHALGIGPYATNLPKPRGSKTIPYAHPLPVSQPPRPLQGQEQEPRARPRAAGGQVNEVPEHEQDIHGVRKTVPVVVAGGEYVVPPKIVAHHPALGAGNPNEPDPKKREMYLKRGHDMLDHWVKETRKKHIKELQKLPGPAR